LGIAEDYAVYVHFALRRAPDPETALGRAVRPMFLSVVLCGAGFAVLMLAGVPAIRQLALFSALALAAGFIWAVVVLPHCPGMDRPREFSPASEAAAGGGALRSGWAVGLSLALAAGLGLAAHRLPLDFSLRGLNLASHALLADQAAVARVWGGDQDRRIFMAQGRTSAEALALAGEVAADLGGRGGTGLSTLAGLCPPPAEQAENLRGWSEFTAALGENFRVEFLKAAASAGFASSAFDPFLEWLQNPPEELDPDRLAGLGWGFLVDYYLAARDGQYYALVEMDAPGPPLTPGFSVFPLAARDLEEALSQALADSSRLLPAVAALACLAALMAAFKNKAEALAAFLPALAGLAAVLALNLLRGRPLGLVEAAALPLIVGLGADYGLVAVSEARLKGSLGAGRAILVSGLSTLAGVGLLALARHPVLRVLGETVSVGLLAAMPAAILGLPRLYSPRAAARDRRENSS
jgi:predicted exporter